METRIPTAVITAFVNTLQKKVNEYRERMNYTKAIHDQHHEVQHIMGRKYDKINIGGGRFMFDNKTGALYFIKGYNTINKKKHFGNIIEINNSPDTWWFDGYSIADKGVQAPYGFAGPITIKEDN